jgi:secondary thiamine-phosphate synthase enzyme
MIDQYEVRLPAMPRGFHLIDKYIIEAVREWPEKGLCHIFIQHTSAALAINEGADPDVRTDLNEIYDRLVPENQPYYLHTDEGPDDMPSHAKAILTGCSQTIPVRGGKLAMGTWQKLYLCEFRDHASGRKLVVTIYS